MTAETYHGRPCARGHSGLRYRSNRKCVACAHAPARYIVFADGRMTVHHTLEDAERHEGEVWIARKV